MGTVQKHFKVGSRESQLAMIQTKWVVETLKKLHSDLTFEIIGMSTIGDRILDVALSKIGDKGLFTQELETALQTGDIDFVVHSLKDLPTQLPQNLTIATISKREDPRDAVLFKASISPSIKRLGDLPSGSVVGTSSLRRIAQLKKHYPHLSFLDVRGNLNTRLRKLDDLEGPYSALILAAAGVNRMGWQERIGQFLEWEDCMHAVGQGALAIECREDNSNVLSLLEPLNDPATYFRCIAERAFLRTLEGGCSVPVAVFTELLFKDDNEALLSLKGSVWSLDGSKSVCETLVRNINSSLDDKESSHEDVGLTSVYPWIFNQFRSDSCKLASAIGVKLGQILIENGAKEILDEVKFQSQPLKK